MSDNLEEVVVLELIEAINNNHICLRDGSIIPEKTNYYIKSSITNRGIELNFHSLCKNGFKDSETPLFRHLSVPNLSSLCKIKMSQETFNKAFYVPKKYRK